VNHVFITVSLMSVIVGCLDKQMIKHNRSHLDIANTFSITMDIKVAR